MFHRSLFIDALERPLKMQPIITIALVHSLFMISFSRTTKVYTSNK